MTLFGFFAVVLVGVYWINRAVRLFDQLISDGQSAIVFLEITALTLPNVIRVMLPVAAFAASLHVANRLTSDSEFVVVQSGGWSRWRLMRPAIAFAVIVALFVSTLTHVVVPAAATRLAERQAEISENIVTRLLASGEFLHPSDGISFYVREITPSGELRDIFLMDTRRAGRNVTYTARRALLVKHGSGPKLAMFDGMVQTLSADGRRLAVTQFDRLVYDVAVLAVQARQATRGIGELSTRELLWPDAQVISEMGRPAAVLITEGHGRISQALLSVVAALSGFAALMLGSFSRFGFLKQIIGAVFALIGLKFADNLMIDIASSSVNLWPLAYLATVLGLAAIAVVILLADAPYAIHRGLRTQQA